MTTRVEITSEFWKRYRELVRHEMIPYQWSVLNDSAGITIEKERLGEDGIPSDKSHAIENFKIAAGRSKGTHYGWVFQDSDVYKWLEAVAYAVREKRDPELEKKAQDVIDLIADAQETDGYLDTFYSILGIEHRYRSLGGSHELYCMGHFIEAAVAYYDATGNEKVLNVAKKCADNINENFGPEEGKIHGYDGHEEIEIGLLRLYHVTGNEDYLKLSKYFLTERGKHPNFFREQAAVYNGPNALGGVEKLPNTYFQNHVPVMEMDTAEGHAVRVVYLCTALADLAATTKDNEIYEVCKKLWDNITHRRMFITGGIGSTVKGEAFTLDYDLPNDTMYCETCAAVGLIFFAKQMLRIESKAEYAEVMERALYNCALAGMALDGKHFFYVNPLEVNVLKSKLDPTKNHVKAVRPSWLGCACCPPNLARLLASLDDYIYMVKDNTVLLNLFIGSKAMVQTKNGAVNIIQNANSPWDESSEVTIENNSKETICFGIRIPKWSPDFTVHYDNKKESGASLGGYRFIEVAAEQTVNVRLEMPMPILRNYADPHVAEDIGKVAISRGPFVYCLEGVDNGTDMNCLSLPEDAKLTYSYDSELLNGVGCVFAEGLRVEANKNEPLYNTCKPGRKPVTLKWIPYFAWANRGENDMEVWIRE